MIVNKIAEINHLIIHKTITSCLNVIKDKKIKKGDRTPWALIISHALVTD